MTRFCENKARIINTQASAINELSHGEESDVEASIESLEFFINDAPEHTLVGDARQVMAELQ